MSLTNYFLDKIGNDLLLLQDHSNDHTNPQPYDKQLMWSNKPSHYQINHSQREHQTQLSDV